MRPGQNRRVRGRSRNKGPNPLTRSYESNGPDVKVRGTAQHIADKYAQLARDAQASSDPVAAENYLQHAEHYYRLIAAAQEQFKQQYGAFQRPFDEEGDEGEDDGQNGFGYGGERPSAGAPGANPMDEFGDGAGFPQAGFGQNGYEGRPDFTDRNESGRAGGRFDRQDRFGGGGGDRGGYDRNGQDRPQRFDRNGYDRNGGGDGRGFDRSGQDRNHQDRNNQDRQPRQGGDRFDRNGERRERYGRENGPRPDAPRADAGRPEGFRQDANRQDGPREAGPREGGRGEGRRDHNRPPRDGQRAEPARFVESEEPAGDLPAFLTTPVRAPAAAPTTTDDTSSAAPAVASTEATVATTDEVAAPKPRRRRTRRTEGALELAEPGKSDE